MININYSYKNYKKTILNWILKRNYKLNNQTTKRVYKMEKIQENPYYKNISYKSKNQKANYRTKIVFLVKYKRKYKEWRETQKMTNKS